MSKPFPDPETSSSLWFDVRRFLALVDSVVDTKLREQLQIFVEAIGSGVGARVVIAGLTLARRNDLTMFPAIAAHVAGIFGAALRDNTVFRNIVASLSRAAALYSVPPLGTPTTSPPTPTQTR